jgi:hypothetical protein
MGLVLGFREREERKKSPVEINLKSLKDILAVKVDLIALGSLDLEATASQCNSLPDKGKPG